MQVRIVREIRMLRAMWRELKRGYGMTCPGTKGETLETDKAVPSGYRASSRPNQGTIRHPQARNLTEVDDALAQAPLAR